MASRRLAATADIASAANAGDKLYLAAFEGACERRLIEHWLRDQGEDPERNAIFYPRARDLPVSPKLAQALSDAAPFSDATLFTPVRIAWLPKQRQGQRRARWRDLLKLNNPRNPSERRKAQLAESAPDRWQVIAGEPARYGELRQRWQARMAAPAENEGPPALARFIARQAELALERAEYRAQGLRYKVPRVVKEDVAQLPSFTRGISQLAATLHRDEKSVFTEAVEYLDELRTAHDPFVLDLAARVFHWLYSRSYGEVDLVGDQIEALRQTFERHPVLLLPSHKTNLDSPVVESVLAQNGLPPPTLFAGINMAFWPVGPLMRRAGRVFLRRKISDNPVYKFALREWLGYLIEKRFNLEWFPEGTRSRTGKLLPPKVGLLSYAADAYRQGHIEDLMLVPIAIVYDQAMDVVDFAREAQGTEKKAEGFGWMLRGLRDSRKPLGKVYLRVGEPLSMRASLGDPDAEASPAEQKLALQKLALAVAWRTNQVSPITGIAVVSLALLAAGERAVTLPRILSYVQLVVLHAQQRGQPLTDTAALDTPEQVLDVLAELIRTGVVSCFDQGPQTVYSVAGGQHLAAAFYRNSMLHFVLDRAIGEWAVLAAAEVPPGDRIERFHQAALELREALKFEFFFRERQEFLGELDAEMTRINGKWQEMLVAGGDPIKVHREIFGLGIAHAVLRPYIEAYHVVADVLLHEAPDAPFDEAGFYDKCQRLGRQYLLQRELRNPESVSKPLFQTGVELARILKLTEPGPDIMERRAQFAARSRASLARVDKAEEAAGREMTRIV
ncbi:glycerol-3-phosphate 1-O-acyltransferase [Sphingomonas tabacisoli]|uniref:Glycerol-3-phosphate acyltransferase n=1 Tax=Sphingomonas tabacisoli TaxID=2249466 RepID=A0ABW4I6T6_9SPHN